MFLVAAAAITMVGVYVVLRYVPDYPLTAANPGNAVLPVASRGEILEAVVRASGAVLVFLALIGLGGGWVLAGRVLRPLQQISAAAAAAASGRLDHRIHLTGRDDEFRQVADAFDAMLAALGDAFEQQQRFAANASHELRTPLSITRTLLDVARRDPASQDHAQLLADLARANDRAVGVTEALLRLADANPLTASTAPVDLADLAAQAVADAASEAAARGVAWSTQLDPAVVLGDAELLAQLTSNLVQNATRHNVASGTARIATGVDRDSGAAWVRTENGGAAYAADVAARLGEPFLRGTGRVSDRPGGADAGTATGHGLGLALVTRITDVHGGVLAIEPRDTGGLVVTVSLPTGPPSDVLHG